MEDHGTVEVKITIPLSAEDALRTRARIGIADANWLGTALAARNHDPETEPLLVPNLRGSVPTETARAAEPPPALSPPIKVKTSACAISGRIAAVATVERRGNAYKLIAHQTRAFHLRGFTQSDIRMLAEEVMEFCDLEEVDRLSICQLTDRDQDGYGTEMKIMTAVSMVPDLEVAEIEQDRLLRWSRSGAAEPPENDNFSKDGLAQLRAVQLAQLALESE